MRVRRVQADEWARLRAFRLRALATDPRAFGATLAEEETLPDDAWRQRASEGAAGSLHLYAVAEDGRTGDWLGMVGGRKLEAEEWEIISLWAAPEARGRGVGESLVESAFSWARDAGAERVVLWYVTENGNAARVYERCGFTREGEATQGRRDPTRWFQKMGRSAQP